jgi:hypothetical protein
MSSNNSSNSQHQNSYVPPGMPPLDQQGRSTSFFEFWPLWLMYLPVALQWLLLACRYRSLTLPLIANPAIPLSGMVGVAKSHVFEVAGDYARQWILPWFVWTVGHQSGAEQADAIVAEMQEQGFSFPLVAKPDIGCRGAGVKLLADKDDLLAYVEGFPRDGRIQLQALSDFEAEAGVFYVRYPGAESGSITSLTLKYTPFVVGDGQRSLGQLIADDPRARDLQHLYAGRHREHWQTVIPAGQPWRLVFSASHCRGAVFRDGREYIDSRLVAALDRIFEDIPGFHYGRLDIKFRDIDSLRAGKDLQIIEINGASSESINIWDRNASLVEAQATLLQQYRTLFKLGDANRRRGHKTPGIRALYRAWRHEQELTKHYPQND